MLQGVCPSMVMRSQVFPVMRDWTHLTCIEPVVFCGSVLSKKLIVLVERSSLYALFVCLRFRWLSIRFLSDDSVDGTWCFLRTMNATVPLWIRACLITVM